MITPDELTAFVELVKSVRTMQAEYRRTICSGLRRRLPLMEMELDIKAERLSVYLAQLAVEAEAEQLAERGAA